MATLEKKLQKAYKNGDKRMLETVFKEIYDTFHKYVFYIASQYLNVESDVEDVCSDTFINFFNHLSDFDFEKSIKYYLVASCKNLSINKAKYYKWQNSDGEIESYGEEDLESYGLHEVLLKYLSEEELKILEYHSIYEYTFDEIGKLINKPANTVKSTYRRAIEKVKQEVAYE